MMECEKTFRCFNTHSYSIYRLYERGVRMICILFGCASFLCLCFLTRFFFHFTRFVVCIEIELDLPINDTFSTIIQPFRTHESKTIFFVPNILCICILIHWDYYTACFTAYSRRHYSLSTILPIRLIILLSYVPHVCVELPSVD